MARLPLPLLLPPAALAAVVLLLLSAGGGHAAPPVPPECVYTGLNFQITCSEEMRNATLALTGNATTDPGDVHVPIEKLRAYLATAPTPRAVCCEALSSFNNLYCFCAPDMVKEFEAWVDMDQMNETAHWLEKRCPDVNRPFTLYMEPNCPVRPVWNPTPEEAAAEEAKGIIPISNRTVEYVPPVAANQTAPTETAMPTSGNNNATNATAQPGPSAPTTRQKKRRMLF